jgi:hypothetical protein
MKPSTGSPNMKKIEPTGPEPSRSDGPLGASSREANNALLGGGHVPFAWPREWLREERLAPRSGPFGLTALMLAGLCAYLVNWNARPLPAASPKIAEFNLQAVSSSSKLNTTSAETSGSSEPALPANLNKQQPVPRTAAKEEEPALPLPLAEPKLEPGPAKGEEVIPATNLEPPPEVPPKESAPPPEAKVVKEEPPLAVPPQPLAVMEAMPVVPVVAAAELTSMAPFAHYVTHQGDSTMTRNWKMYGLQAFLAAALTAAPALATAGPEDNDTEKNEKKTDKSDKDVTNRLNRLEKQIKEVLEAAKAITAEGLKIQTLKGRLDRLEADMGKVLEDLDTLKKGKPEEKEEKKGKEGTGLDELKVRLDKIDKFLESRFGPNGRIAKSPPTESGRILLTNRYPEEIIFIINGESFRLAPGMSRLLDAQQAGPFTYEMISPRLGSRARKTTTLLPNQTFRLTAVELPENN